MSTHIGAQKDEIANIVLMPGDPLRAKMIAETYLSDVKIINTVRNMLGYTGVYKTIRVTDVYKRQYESFGIGSSSIDH